MLDPDVRAALLGVARDLTDAPDGTRLMGEAVRILMPLADRGDVTRDQALRAVMAVGGYYRDTARLAEMLDAI